MKINNTIQLARTALVFDLPFFGFLSLKLKLHETPGLGTCSTDGKCLRYDPEVLKKWNKKEICGVVVHEILHCVAEHFLREDEHVQRRFGYSYTGKIKRQNTLTNDERDELTRIHDIWNRACDYTVNLIIDNMNNSKIALPDDSLLDRQFNDNSTEQVFDILWKETNNGCDGQQAPQWGLVQPDDSADSNSAASRKEQSRQWKINIKQAIEIARAKGNLPRGLEQFIDELLAPKVSWKTILWDFVERVSSNDYSWVNPRRKYLSQHIYLPSMISDEIPLIVFATDTSGSMFDREIQQAGGELQSILDTFNTTLMAMFADAAISDNNIRTFCHGDCIDISFTGRGGTDFRPVFDYISDNDIQPSCLIYLTDMEGTFPSDAPEYPVLWIDTRDNGGNPFGDRIVMEVEGCNYVGY